MKSVNTEHKELIVITKTYDLVREMMHRTKKLPRDVKFVLGDRILATVYDILDSLLEARYKREKLSLLREVNIYLERLRYQVRLCHDEKYISIRQYEYIAGLINEVGSMVGGWIKDVSQRKRVGS